MAVKIKVEKFEGPLDLLLQLIEREELSITEISLSKIADQYLAYLESVARRDPEELADFLVVAAKLLLLKSRELLPSAPVPEDEGPSLASQLRMYKIFWEAAQRLERVFKEKRFISFRDKLPASIAPRFSPPPGISGDRLRAAFVQVLERITPIVKYPEERLKKTVSIQEKIDRIRSIIQKEATVRFREILAGAASKTEVVVNFLALLELVRARTVSVTQDEAFGDILISRVTQQE